MEFRTFWAILKFWENVICEMHLYFSIDNELGVSGVEIITFFAK